jgi:hypothetical protein
VIRWINDDSGETQGVTSSESIKINKKTNIDLLISRIIININSIVLKYLLDESESYFILRWKEWLPSSEFKASFEVVTEEFNLELSKKNNKYKKLSDIRDNRVKINILDKYKHLLMNNYGIEIWDNKTFIGYKINDYEGIKIKTYLKDLGIKYNEVSVLKLINGKFIEEDENLNLIKWKDSPFKG